MIPLFKAVTGSIRVNLDALGKYLGVLSTPIHIYFFILAFDNLTRE